MPPRLWSLSLAVFSNNAETNTTLTNFMKEVESHLRKVVEGTQESLRQESEKLKESLQTNQSSIDSVRQASKVQMSSQTIRSSINAVCENARREVFKQISRLESEVMNSLRANTGDKQPINLSTREKWDASKPKRVLSSQRPSSCEPKDSLKNSGGKLLLSRFERQRPK